MTEISKPSFYFIRGDITSGKTYLTHLLKDKCGIHSMFIYTQFDSFARQFKNIPEDTKAVFVDVDGWSNEEVELIYNKIMSYLKRRGITEIRQINLELI